MPLEVIGSLMQWRGAMIERTKIRPELECDVIMAGGITSGVVFPQAILKLKDKYAFRSIGGTSAGAIAAAISAAAEYGRRGGFEGAKGFSAVAEVPQELQKNLNTLFQPTAAHRPLFGFLNSLIGVNRQGWLRMALTVLGNAVRFFPVWAILGLLFWGVVIVGQVIALFDGRVSEKLIEIVPWLAKILPLPMWLSALAISICLVALCMATLAGAALIGVLLGVNTLRRTNYGLCPGLRQGGGDPGVVDWIDAKINVAAGLKKDEAGKQIPLTFGDLEGKDKSKSIQLRMMTSNLTHGTGEILPRLAGGTYYFREKDMREILPAYVVDHMMKNGSQKTGPDNAPLYRVPAGDDMPVILAVRMSLNFPVLFTAVPLFCEHYWGEEAAANGNGSTLECALFSDGGITSNFPVRFFDSLIPSRPTFGISLDDFPVDPDGVERRHPRVYLPMNSGEGRQQQSRNIGSLSSFLFAIVNTAREWQDRKQGSITGYRERISHIFLKEQEGGLRLDMPQELITQLGLYGARAGALMAGDAQMSAEGGAKDKSNFDFDDHQWRRFLIAYAQLEAMLEAAHASWTGLKGKPPISEAIRASMNNPKSYKQAAQKGGQQIFARMDALFKQFDRIMLNPPSGSPCAPGGMLRAKKGWFPKDNAKLQIVADD
jgi:predicted acylesterase/phospholipase RssA